jgi:hypothetical protein
MLACEKSFGERNFGHAKLGDKRRTMRLVQVADQMVHRPGGTLPEKINSPKDLKAMYRLFECEEVTHEAIMEAHQICLLTEVLPPRDGFTLVIHDTTEFDYTKKRSLQDLGQIGSGHRRGYLAHNSLLVCPETGNTLGLINQVLHQRVAVSKTETRKQRQQRKSCESRLWLKGTQPLPSDRKIIDVCDRGADAFPFIRYEAQSGRTFLIRSKTNRNCFVGHENQTESTKLHSYARSLPVAGTWELAVTSKTEMKSPNRKGKKRPVTRTSRTANMAVSFGAVQLKPGKSDKVPPVPVWVLRAWETDPPTGQERLEWVLITNHPVVSFQDAFQVVGWYERRWVIEEYHKCLKTGMSIEGFQFTDTARLEPAIALTSIAAITLLRLRDDSRQEETKNRPATQYIDREYVEVLSSWRHGKPRYDWTVSEFVLALARLSGHQNRRGDHPPGWQKLWKGWFELQAMLTGARIAKKIQRCG